MGLGWLTLIPEHADAPLARVRLNAAMVGVIVSNNLRGQCPGRIV